MIIKENSHLASLYFQTLHQVVIKK